MSEQYPQSIQDIINDKSLTNSEKDRMIMMIDPKMQFLEYLSTCVTSLTNKSIFFEEIEKSLNDDLISGSLPLAAKIRIFEILSKKETDVSANVLNVLAKAIETKNKTNPSETPANSSDKGHSNVSQEDYAKAKNVMNVIDRISKGEFSPEEFFHKK